MNRWLALFGGSLLLALIVGHLLRDTPGYMVRNPDGTITGDITHYVYWTRLVTLGGSGQAFEVHPRQMLEKELELLGSRYVTRQEVIEALDLVARGKLDPLVSEVVPMTEAEALHQRVEQGLVTGRAALRIA